MTPRPVGFDAEALDDLRAIERWIGEAASPERALAYIDRIITFCDDFGTAPERGTRHPHLGEGVRSVGFEGRVAVVFEVTPSRVTILGVHYGGRDWLPRP